MKKPRLLPYLILTVFALLTGGYAGALISYWFVPEIMRLELSPADYPAKLPQLLRDNFPPGSRKIIITAEITGALTTALCAVGLYYVFNKRK